MSPPPSHPSWSGDEALLAVNGPPARFPPLRALFLAHRLAADGALHVQVGEVRARLTLRGGAVFEADGVPALLASLGPEYGAETSTGAGIAAAVAGGVTVDAAAEAAAVGVGRFVAAQVGVRDGLVAWEPSARPARGAFPLPLPVPRLIAEGLRLARPSAQVSSFWGAADGARLVATPPDDAPETRWGLDATSLRVLRLAPREPTVGSLVGAVVGGVSARRVEVLRAIDLLYLLGLLDLQASARPVATPLPARAGPDPRADDLRARLATVEGRHPVDVLGLGEAQSLAAPAVESAWRELGARAHPDGFADASPEVAELAHRLFDTYRAAREALGVPGALDEANRLLDARRKGIPYVSDKDRAAARIAYRRGETLFRSRAWKEADACFQQALSLDPSWPHPFYEVWCGWLARRVSGVAAELGLARLEPPTPRDKAEVLVARATIAKVEGRPDDAARHFRAAAEADPANRDAQRELRLDERRAAPAPAAAPGLVDQLKALTRKK